jgi:hypothetical protein
MTDTCNTKIKKKCVFFFIHEVLNFRKLIIGQKSNIFLTDFLAEKKVLRNKSSEQKLQRHLAQRILENKRRPNIFDF